MKMFERKKAIQMKLTETARFADSIIANMIDTLIVVDAGGVIKTVNKATLDLLGYEEKELIDQPVGIIFANDDDDDDAFLFKGKKLEKLIKEGSVRNFEMTYKTKSGEKIPVSFSGSVMYETSCDMSPATHDARRIIGIVGIARDMRETKRLFAALKNQSDTFENKTKKYTYELSILYDVANAISYTLNKEELIKQIMESIFKIVNYDICGALLFSADTASIILKPAYPESVALADELKEKLITSTSTITGENLRAKKIDIVSLPFFVETRPPSKQEGKGLKSIFNIPFVVQNKITGMLTVGSCEEKAFGEEDVKIFYTISNQTSIALERLTAMIAAERTKMESMVESMIEGVIMLDVRKELVVFNPKARELLGFGLKEDIGSATLNERLKTVRLDGAIEECWALGNLVVKETIIPHGEKNIILHSDTALVRNDRQETIGAVMILRDVTNEREIDNMKTEFVATVSHELRTPLAILKEGINLVRDKVAGPINNEQERFLVIANSNIERLTGIIENLLNVSKIEAGKIEFKKQRVDLVDLIEKVISSFEPRLKKKGLELKMSFPQDGVAVYADANTMTEVFINLINNALKFTEHGYVEVSVCEKEALVLCMVADSGKGIAHNDLSKVFGMFQQFDRPAGGAGEKGTGLGLAITKKIIERHKGKIWVESELNKGTKFIFTLPKYIAKKDGDDVELSTL